VLAVDRAGLVGEDGRTHQGIFDLSFLRTIPGLIVSAPKDELELQHLLYTAVQAGKPMAIRYPRGTGRSEIGRYPEGFELIPIGDWELSRTGDDLCVLSTGSSLNAALAAAEILEKEGISCSVVNARFVKPLDVDLLMELCNKTQRLVTVEENTLVGGFGSAVLEALEEHNVSSVKVLRLGLPDAYIEHGPQTMLRSMHGLDPEGIANRIRLFCQIDSPVQAEVLEQ
jgi:1-deoxy-D-xylulose-5-phosphate synthase